VTQKKTKKKRTRRNKIDVIPEPLYPWERQPNEDEQSFAAFIAYIKDGSDRTKRAVANRLGRPYDEVAKIGAMFDWDNRAKAWDINEDRKDRKSRQVAVKEMHDRHARNAMVGVAAAMATLAKYIKTPDNPNPMVMHERDAIRLFDVSAKIERLSRGEPDTIQEHKGEVSTTVSVEDKRASMVRLLEDAEAVEHLAAISKKLGTDGSNGKG
jgi:hypothetical protein